jgi:hypothetical protein
MRTSKKTKRIQPQAYTIRRLFVRFGTLRTEARMAQGVPQCAARSTLVVLRYPSCSLNSLITSPNAFLSTRKAVAPTRHVTTVTRARRRPRVPLTPLNPTAHFRPPKSRGSRGRSLPHVPAAPASGLRHRWERPRVGFFSVLACCSRAFSARIKLTVERAPK